MTTIFINRPGPVRVLIHTGGALPAAQEQYDLIVGNPPYQAQ